ncbi:MAG: hypothetical protein ACR2N5_03820 [Solirubrobacterales bacterium]
MSRSRAIVAGLAIAVISAAGCGGDSTDSATGDRRALLTDGHADSDCDELIELSIIAIAVENDTANVLYRGGKDACAIEVTQTPRGGVSLDFLVRSSQTVVPAAIIQICAAAELPSDVAAQLQSQLGPQGFEGRPGSQASLQDAQRAGACIVVPSVERSEQSASRITPLLDRHALPSGYTELVGGVGAIAVDGAAVERTS